jgi:hypothetical protein
MGCISHWLKAFLIVMNDFVVFAEGGEYRSTIAGSSKNNSKNKKNVKIRKF